MTSGAHDDGQLGEVFLKLGKQGSTLAGVMDAFSIAVSIGLQYGVPLETYVSKFTNLRFEPAGLTDDPDVRMSQSIMDYIFRRLALDYLSFEDRSMLGIYSAEERQRHLETGSYEPLVEETGSAAELVEAPPRRLRRGRRGRGRRDQGHPRLRGPRGPGPGVHRRGQDHRRALREAHRHRRRLPALHDLRHEDAAGWLVLRVRGLREHQRLQLINDRTAPTPLVSGPFCCICARHRAARRTCLGADLKRGPAAALLSHGRGVVEEVGRHRCPQLPRDRDRSVAGVRDVRRRS